MSLNSKILLSVHMILKFDALPATIVSSFGSIPQQFGIALVGNLYASRNDFSPVIVWWGWRGVGWECVMT